jgi:hypothetical protein
MFSRIFSQRRGIFAQKALPLFLAFCFVLGSALFSGCSMGEDSSGNIIGTWVSNFDEKWVITPNSVTSYGYDGTIAYDGRIRNSPDFAAPAGVIIIEYMTKPQYYDYDNDYNKTGPFDPPGDYYAIYWKSLTAASIELSNAWDVSDFNHTGAPETKTLSEAETKFTLDNAASYVGGYSTCERR